VCFIRYSFHLFPSVTFKGCCEVTSWLSMNILRSQINRILSAKIQGALPTEAWVPPQLLSVKGEVFPLQSWAGPWGSGRLRLLDFLDIRHYEGSKVVTLTHRPPLPPGVILVLIFSGWVDPRAHGSVGSFEKIPSDTTGDRSRDPPTRIAVFYPLRYPVSFLNL
jgi:hypothetical protein